MFTQHWDTSENMYFSRFCLQGKLMLNPLPSIISGTCTIYAAPAIPWDNCIQFLWYMKSGSLPNITLCDMFQRFTSWTITYLIFCEGGRKVNSDVMSLIYSLKQRQTFCKVLLWYTFFHKTQIWNESATSGSAWIYDMFKMPYKCYTSGVHW